MRLDKFLSNSLGLSRSQIKEQLKKKQVTVDGIIVTDGSTKVFEGRSEVSYMGKTVQFQKYVYYMFHKPAGCVTARTDKEHLTVFDYTKDIPFKDLFAVGRLDKDTEGLLFLTNDGSFDHALMSPKRHVDKTYYFEAVGNLSPEAVTKLENGVCIGKDEPFTKPAKVAEIQNYQDNTVTGLLTITEGRFHQVKRMLHAVNCEIRYLKRIAIGKVFLDEELPKGSYRALTEEEKVEEEKAKLEFVR